MAYTYSRKLLVVALTGLMMLATGAAFAASPNAGATLQASKTIDICTIDSTSWLYSGVVSVWNNGTTDATGLTINDCIQSKISGPVWTVNFCNSLSTGTGVVPGNTPDGNALTFPYSFTAAPLAGSIRNVATTAIENHSGGKTVGPEPKATWTGGVPPSCALPGGGCTYTQGYWGNKPGVIWPAPYDRLNPFYSSGLTWQQVLDTAVNVAPGYYQLAHQYEAAVLNAANGASVPAGIQDILNQADTFFTNNAPAACSANGSCGTQKTWAAILTLYNEGKYPGGPSHCGDEQP